MPMSRILLVRARELGRRPVAADFTLVERKRLADTLALCIREADECGDVLHADRLRDDWTFCIQQGTPPLDDGPPPRFEPIPALVERRRRHLKRWQDDLG